MWPLARAALGEGAEGVASLTPEVGHWQCGIDLFHSYPYCELRRNTFMPKLPCIMCGKDVFATGGSNTIYDRADGNVYACHSSRSECDGGLGSYATDVKVARLAEMSVDEKKRSRCSSG